MDRRDVEGRERTMAVASQESQSVVKLPLAPILSIPHSSPNNNNNSNAATGSTRRGISIFSPTQTLDQHTFPPPPPPPPPPPQPQPDPDPTTSTSTTPRNQELIISTTSSATPVLTRYRECQKNHAANVGGHVVDGCGEFMPSGEPGTPESLRCAACDCHRNFHRKEVENNHYQHPHHHHHQNNSNYNINRSQHGGRGVGGPRMVNFGGGGESSSEEMNLAQPCSYSGSKKRFRTKFSQEQKDKMHELAERLGWRMQKQNEGEVQQLCNELGVKRQVFKVWMHNNKQAMKKRQTEE